MLWPPPTIRRPQHEISQWRAGSSVSGLVVAVKPFTLPQCTAGRQPTAPSKHRATSGPTPIHSPLHTKRGRGCHYSPSLSVLTACRGYFDYIAISHLFLLSVRAVDDREAMEKARLGEQKEQDANTTKYPEVTHTGGNMYYVIEGSPLVKRPLSIYGLLYALNIGLRMKNCWVVHERLPYLLGVSSLLLDYEYCELPMRRMQKGGESIWQGPFDARLKVTNHTRHTFRL